MKEFKDRVAVITGAASGIGRGLARRCAQEGMKLVLADIDVPALANTAAELQATGAVILTVPTDVSKAGDVEALAHKTLETFGAIHLLCNNAGVATVPVIWESSLEEWEWILALQDLPWERIRVYRIRTAQMSSPRIWVESAMKRLWDMAF